MIIQKKESIKEEQEGLCGIFTHKRNRYVRINLTHDLLEDLRNIINEPDIYKRLVRYSDQILEHLEEQDAFVATLSRKDIDEFLRGDMFFHVLKS